MWGSELAMFGDSATRRGIKRLSAVLAVVAIVSGCSAAAPSVAPESSTSSASAATSPSSTVASASAGSASPSRAGEAVTVKFLKAVPPKRWGDPPFKVTAQASNKAKLSYAAAGPCSVDRTDGVVTIRNVGTCTVTATTATGPTVKASLAVEIARAHPSIRFTSRSVRYTRPFVYRLAATVAPSIPLSYRLIAAGSGDDCRLQSGRLTLAGVQPNLRQDCIVEASAAGTSSAYDPPTPVRATIHVDFPSWNVDAISKTVTYDPANPTVKVTVRETSGDALGIDVSTTGDTFQCQPQSVTPASPPPAGTTTYSVVLRVDEPPAGGYTCTMEATALPPDYFDPGGKSKDAFTVTVKPASNPQPGD
jgi:hypothetical protein